MAIVIRNEAILLRFVLYSPFFVLSISGQTEIGHKVWDT